MLLLVVIVEAAAAAAEPPAAAAASPPAPSPPPPRQSLPFDYNWQFKRGEPAGAVPPLVSGSDAGLTFPKDISGMVCNGLSVSAQGTCGNPDCTAACATMPGCLAWLDGQVPGINASFGGTMGCYIHDPSRHPDPPVCTRVSPAMRNHGGSRVTAPIPTQNRVGVSWAKAEYDDAAWESVSAPHDFVVAGAYVNDPAGRMHGYLQRNVSGWYRKHFGLPTSWAADNGATWLHFEGVFHVAEIWVNGHFMLQHRLGSYLGFDLSLSEVDVRKHLRYGAASQAEPNVIAIRVDASFGSGHWYEGGGITRPVHLLHTQSPLRFEMDGVFAVTAKSKVEPGSPTALVFPSAEVLNGGGSSTSAMVQYSLYDRGTNERVGLAWTPPATVAAGTGATLIDNADVMTVSTPKLWSVKSPTLYTMVAELYAVSTGKPIFPPIDRVNITVGLRKIDWNAPGGGFALNNVPIHLRGFSNHADFGGVGEAVPARIDLFKANALRSVGGNTWRCSHNPYPPHVYDILDAIGVMVWDENRDFSPGYVQDMGTMVRRDRNHPSVVIWSICNEGECFVAGQGNESAKNFVAEAKKWDTTRPVSGNSWHMPKDNVTLHNLSPYLDVEGFSHASISWAADVTAVYPGRTAVSSECCSCEMQRGENYVDGLNVQYAADIGQATCMKSCVSRSYDHWRGDKVNPAGVVAGSLGVWTLFDYGGEPGNWPIVSSSFGQFDLAGFAKSASYWYRAQWLAGIETTDPGRPLLPAAHVVRVSQAWTPPPFANATLDHVIVFSDLQSIELVLNGRSLGFATTGGAPAGEPGAAVVSTCDGSAMQKMQLVPTTMQIKSAVDGECLSSACRNGPPPTGCYPLMFEPCSATSPVAPDQVWTYDSKTGAIINGKSAAIRNTSLCLDIISAGAGQQIGLYTCSANKLGQEWTANGSTFQTKADPQLGRRCMSNGSPPPPPTPFGFASFNAVKYAAGNLTAIGRHTHNGAALATHTQLTPGVAKAIVLSLDAPSLATGTGSALLLDGHDAGLVRATVVDAMGLTVDTSCVISFEATNGPGRVVGVHNGNASSHEPQVASSRMAYHGLARAVVKVSADAASVGAEALALLATEVEVGCTGVCNTQIWSGDQAAAGPSSITVTATSPGLPTATVEIPVSTDATHHSVLATATAAAKAGIELTFD